jgi:beta-lactamase regulating signal transducer with metallopeptidase domain
MALVFDYLDPLARTVLEVLLNSFWQGAVLASLLWCVLRLFRRTNATTRYALWYVTLAAICCLPLLASLRAERVSIAHASATNASSNRETLSATGHALEVGTQADALPGAFIRPARLDSVNTNEVVGAGMIEDEKQRSASGFQLTIFLGRWVLLCAGLYLFAASWMVSRVVRSYRRLRRLKKESTPLSGAHQTRFEELLKVCGIRRAVSLAASREIAMPLAAGLGHAVILIPQKLVDELTEEEFSQILLHELAHIRRYDDWTNLFQKLAEAIFFFHPVVHWVGARLNLEREVACDDWVIWMVGERRPYATCLARLVELVATPRPASLAPGAATIRKHVFKRVEFLLDRKRNSLPRLSRASCVVLLGVLSVALLQCLRVPAVFAVSAEPRAAHVPASAEPGALVPLPALQLDGAQTRELAQTQSEKRQEDAESSAVSVAGRGLSESRAREPRRDADAAQSRPEESQAEFDRQLQELMKPKVREAERRMLAVMQPKIHEVERAVYQLIGPKLEEVSRLEGEAARERQRELQKEVELSLGAKQRELQKQIDRMMEPRVREIEREARQTLLERQRNGGRR